MVETLSRTFNAIPGGGGGGGNVFNVMLHVDAATLRGLTYFIMCAIQCRFRKNPPWGSI